MAKIEILDDCYRWPTDDFALASLGVRLADLAARHSLRVEQWEEDGLGTAQGVMCRTSSGLVFLLRELPHAITYLGARGPDVFVDAEVLGARGLQTLLNEIMSVLDLSAQDFTWVQDVSMQAEAAARARWVREFREHRRQAGQ